MRKKQGLFTRAYLLFVLLLILCIAAAILYVHSLLQTYENAQPERLVEEAIDALISQAEDGSLFAETTLWTSDTKWELHLNLQEKYTSLLTSDGVTYAQKTGLYETDELVYSVKTEDGFLLAEVALEAIGSPVTKLAVFTWQDWRIQSITPILTPTTYTLSVPSDFSVTVNGTLLPLSEGEQQATDEILYTFENLYFRPVLEIRNTAGEMAEFVFKGTKIVPMIYDYHLTLPSSLEVYLNGVLLSGTALESGHLDYDIRLLQKPDIKICDLYGNVVSYEGGNSLPLTYLTLEATDQYLVTVEGKNVPTSAVSSRENPEYTALAAYVPDLPVLLTYNLALLKDNADITITDPHGAPVVWDKSTHTLDLTEPIDENAVPADIAAETDVLYIAKQWSLFVSKDLPGANNGFDEIAKYLIPTSYQYEIATAYANGTDIGFTSVHTLKDPPFSNETVSNFIRISDTCFSVDVSFDKHMILYYGTEVVDSMRERLYFVKYDDPADSTDIPSWKLASMKELGGYAE